MKNILIPKDKDYLLGQITEMEKETKELAKKLGAAAAHGGSFQIPEYMSIEERLRAINERDQELRKILTESDIVSFEEIDDKKVGFYCLVKTNDEESDFEENFYLIHPELSDNIDLGSNILPVSPKSIVGKALIGKKSGDVVEISLPKGKKTLKIIHFEKKEY